MRIIKTKKAVEDAFFSLMEETSFEKVSIKEICSRARIGNATFYYHYNSKQDLAEQLARKYFSELRSTILWQLSMFEEGASPSEVWDRTSDVKTALSRKRQIFLKIHLNSFDFEKEMLGMLEEIIMLRVPRENADDDRYAMRINIAARQLMCYYSFIEDSGYNISPSEYFNLGHKTLHDYYGSALATLSPGE